MSVSVITLTISVYAYYTDLRDTHGKCLMSLLSSLLLIYIFLPTTRFHKYLSGSDGLTIAMNMLMLTGFLMTFFWFTTISFHVYWRLKCVKISNFIIFQYFCNKILFLTLAISKRTWKRKTNTSHT